RPAPGGAAARGGQAGRGGDPPLVPGPPPRTGYRMKSCLRQIAFLLFMALLFVGTVIGVASLFRPAGKSNRIVRVEIPRHATVRMIAERLEEKKLIRHRYAFMLMARLLGESNHMKAGEYE